MLIALLLTCCTHDCAATVNLQTAPWDGIRFSTALSHDAHRGPGALDCVEAIGQGWGYSAAEGMDGGIQLSLTNPGRGVDVLVDAGTVFQGPDGYQPAVVTEDVLVFVPAGSTMDIACPTACGKADAMGGGFGILYDRGVSKLDPQACRIIDRAHAELASADEVVQDVIWVYTDGHDFASVYVPEREQSALMRILEEEVEGFEQPGYAVRYREPDPEDGGRFSGEPMEIRCEFSLNVARAERCRVILIAPDGASTTMLSEFQLHAGQQQFNLTLGLEGYPPGEYALQLEGQRSGAPHFRRDFTLQGRS